MNDDDKWNAAANRIDQRFAELDTRLKAIANALNMNAAALQALIDLERARAQARVGQPAQEHFLANQQPRVDGDHRPWEPQDGKRSID